METSSSFAVSWIFSAVSVDTPKLSWIAEVSFSGKGDVEASGAGVGEDDGTVEGSSVGIGVFVGCGTADGAGAPVAGGVFVGCGTADGAGTPVAGGGVMAGVGSSVGWGVAKVTATVWLLWTSCIL